MNRRFRFLEPGPDDTPIVIITTEQDILDTCFDWWSSRMLSVGKLPMATEQNCLEDWIVVHWAEELKD